MSTSVNEQTFQREVLQASVPVLVNFWAPWCGICKMITPLLTRFQLEWEGQVQLVDVNADKNFRLANQYRLTNLPTLLFFDNGELCHRLDSFRGKDDLRMMLDAFMRSRQLKRQLPDFAPIYPYQEVPHNIL